MLGFFIPLIGLACGLLLRDIIIPKPKEIDMTYEK